MSSVTRISLVATGFFTAGFITALAILTFLVHIPHLHPEWNEKHESDDDYSLVNPLLWCDQPEAVAQTALIPFENDVVTAISNLKKSNNLSSVSYYFRELDTGYWIAQNEEEKFIPASLLKLPVYMAMQKQAETNPQYWDQLVSVPTTASDAAYTPSIVADIEPFEVESTHPLREIAKRMITFSDNQSRLAVQGTYDPRNELELYRIIGTELPKEDLDFLTVRKYGSLFRLLYNASYLSPSASQQTLELLSKVAYADGIRAGVPENIVVAHKFGERERNGVQQLHDCGIVYHPNRPYLLCIMTRGNSTENLQNAIQTLSKLTYEKVDTNK